MYSGQRNLLEDLLKDLEQANLHDLVNREAEVPLGEAVVVCGDCGVVLSASAETCGSCGASQRLTGGALENADDDDDVPAQEFAVGEKVYAVFYADLLHYKAVIERELEGGRGYLVLFTEYGNTQETAARDILPEAQALALVAEMERAGATADKDGGKVVGGVQFIECKSCGNMVSASLFSCSHCNARLKEVEDPEARAARILMELTPWGLCKGCGNTIMQSDDVCMLCLLPRGQDKPDRRSGALKKPETLPEPASEPNAVVSPRKGTLLQRLRGSDKREPTQEQPSQQQQSPAADAAPPPPGKDDPPKRSTPLLSRSRNSDKDLSVPKEEPMSPRRATLMERLRGAGGDKKPEEPVVVSPVASPIAPAEPASPKLSGSASKVALFSRRRDKGEAAAEAPESHSPDSRKDEAPARPAKMGLLERMRSPRGSKEQPKESPAADPPSLRQESGESPKPVPSGPQSHQSGNGLLLKLSKKTVGFLRGRPRVQPSAAPAPTGDANGDAPAVTVDPKAQRGPVVLEKKQLQKTPATTKIVLHSVAPVVDDHQHQSHHQPSSPPSVTAAGPKPPALPPKPKLAPRPGQKAAAAAVAPKNTPDSPVLHAAPGPPPSLVRSCSVCAKAILDGDPVVEIEGTTSVAHAGCWKCVYCHVPLRAYFLVENSAVCGACFKRNVENRLCCSVCKEPVSTYFRVGDAIFCDEHYKSMSAQIRCHACSKPLSSYYTHEGKRLCEDDYRELVLPKCCVCKAPQTKWVEYGGEKFCQRHFEERKQKDQLLCGGCSKPIEGKYVKYGDGSFHGSCFRCSECKAELGSKFHERNGAPLCAKCVAKSPPQSSASSKSPSQSPPQSPTAKGGGGKFCIYCGTPMGAGASFCSQCGQRR